MEGICGIHIQVEALGLWDGHYRGRFGAIITGAPKRARGMLCNYFATVDCTKVILADTRYPDGCLPYADCPQPLPEPPAHPVLMLGRYVGNVYVAVAGMAQTHIATPSVLLFVEWLLDTVYQIKMKWGTSELVVRNV